MSVGKQHARGIGPVQHGSRRCGTLHNTRIRSRTGQSTQYCSNLNTPIKRVCSSACIDHLVQQDSTPPLARNRPFRRAAGARRSRAFSTICSCLSAAFALTMASTSLCGWLAPACKHVSTSSSRKSTSVLSQNCQGLKTEARITEFVSQLRRRNTWLATVQETWRFGQEDFTQDGYCFLGSGPPTQQANFLPGPLLTVNGENLRARASF